MPNNSTYFIIDIIYFIIDINFVIGHVHIQKMYLWAHLFNNANIINANNIK